MVRAKFDYELVRGVNRKQSKFARILHGKGPKKPKGEKGKKLKAEWAKKVNQKKRDKKAKRIAIRLARGQTGKLPKGKPFRYAKKKTHPKLDDDETRAGFWTRTCKRKRHPKPIKHRLPKLKKNLTPGTVCILLAGPCMGRRVIFLKQLPSGLICTIGPKKANGDTLRRISQSYVISTSKKVDLQYADLSRLPEVTDEYFEVKKKFKKNREWKTMVKKKEFIPTEKEPTWKPHKIYKQTQLERIMNKQIWRCVKRDIPLRYYLNAKFRLSLNDYPHLMKF